MPANTNYYKLGLFVLTGTLIGIGAVFWIAAHRLTRETIVAYAFFDESVSGLEEGSPVKFRGVKIGHVATINVAPDHRHVEVRAEIYTDALERLGLRDPDNLPEPGATPFVQADLRVTLVSSALTGLTFVQSDFFDDAPIPVYKFDVPWNTIHSVTSTYKSLEDGITVTLDSLPRLTEEAAELFHRLHHAIDELAPAELSQQARSMMAAIEREVDAIRDARVVERSTATLDEIRALAADLRGSEGPVHRVADRLDALGARIEQEIDAAQIAPATAALRRAAEKLEGAADEAGRLGRAARAEIRALADALAAVRRLAELLERDPGALLHGRTPSTSPSGRSPSSRK